MAGLSCLISTGLLAAPLQHPKRLINAYTVDLTPLFKWWSKHEGKRPLSAWVHVTGSIVGTNAAGWILEAQVEGLEKDKGLAAPGEPAHGPMKIVLRSPPLEDLTEFERLTSELNTLNVQRGTLAAEADQAKASDQAVAQQQRGARGARSRVLALEDRRLKRTEQEAKARQQPLDQQIQAIKAKLAVYPKTDHYEVDCFALDMQYDFDRLPVYDHGQVVN